MQFSDVSHHKFTGHESTPNASYILSNNIWSASANMNYERGWAASVTMNGKVIVLGGSGDATTTYELLEKDGFVMGLAPLPEPMSDHCLGKINETHFFVAGNSYNEHMAYIFDATHLPDLNYIQLPPMLKGRYAAACGFVSGVGPVVSDKGPDDVNGGYDGDTDNDVAGNGIIVVAGGVTYEDYGYRSSSEYFSLDTFQWTNGPDLKYKIGWMGSTSTRDHPMLVVGGYDPDFGRRKEILSLNTEQQKFEFLPGQLQIGRDAFGMVAFQTEEICD